jgi:hypothetical protein
MNPLSHARRGMHLRTAALSGALLYLLLVAVGFARLPALSPAAAAPAFQSCRDWAVIQMPNIPEKINVLTAVSASSHDDIWAVGYTREYGNVPDTARTLAMHWDGREWRIVPTPNPNPGNNYLDDVAALGPNDAWAVGDSGTTASPRSILLHWDGTAWTPGTLPPLHEDGSGLYSIAALAPNDIWVVGFAGNNVFSSGIVLHYDGSQWGVYKTFALARASIFHGVAARSANDVWAVGARLNDQGLAREFLARWDGTAWTQVEEHEEQGVVSSPAWDVALAPSTGEVWIVGGTSQPVILHRGPNWWTRTGTDLRVADRNYLRAAVATSNTDVWAVGYGESPNVLRPLIVRTTNGTDWTSLPGAAVDGNGALYDIASIPGGDLIAVGTANGAVLVEMYRDPCAPAPAPATPAPEATQPPAATATPTPVPTFAPTPIPGDTTRTFPETGKTVRGLFLDYWQNNGGLAQQGYPISDMFTEVSALNGKPYTVQYFERAVFEYHPENQPPYNVLLSQLGTFQYKKKYPTGAPGQTPNTSEGSMLFAETGKRVGGKFLAYWQQNGGLAQQGYPISDEFMEKSDLNGQTYLVQYFERAVFELHPENQPPFDVLLSQLGTFQYREKYGTK